MKIRLRHDLGVCEGYLNAKKGDVLEVAESSAVRYIKLGYADPVNKGEKVALTVERAVAQEKNVETATSEIPAAANLPKALDEDVDVPAVVETASKPAPGARPATTASKPRR